MEAYPTPGAIVSGRYRIDALLGEGGMGAVFRATELSANVGVALKFPSPEMRVRPGMASRFANEAVAASRIACEHVVQIYGVETTEGGTPFIVMELLAGRDLDAIVEHEAPLPPARAVHFTLQILRALQVAHAAGVVHRDLKPSNALVVSRDGDPDYVKLIDFGITKILGDDKGLTKTSTTLGTPAYMAPEQAKSAKSADARSDLYSVGVILYELLTRRQPFEGESQNEIVIKICTEPPMPIRSVRADLPAGLASAVEHALVKAPLGRYPSAEAFAAGLEPFADERSRAVLARMHAGVTPMVAGAGAFALAPTPMADAPPMPAPRPSSGTAMMDESLLPAELRAGLAAAPPPGHVIITPPGMEALPREAAGKTVVGEVSFGAPPEAGPSLVSAASPALATPPPAVPYVPGPPPSDYEERGGGRGALLAVLGVVAVALIGGGIYLAVRSPGGGGSSPSAGPGKNDVQLSDDDDKGGASGKKKKPKKADDSTGDDDDDKGGTAAASDTNAPTPTTAPAPVRPTTPTPTPTATTTSTTGATATPSTSTKPSGSAPVPTGTIPTGIPTSSTPTIIFPTAWPPRGVPPKPTAAPTTTTTTAPTQAPTVAPTSTVPGKPRPRFGGG